MLISDNAGAHEDDRLEEGNEIIHKPRSYFKNATDKALAGEMTVGEAIFSFVIVPVMAIVGCIFFYFCLKGK